MGFVFRELVSSISLVSSGLAVLAYFPVAQTCKAAGMHAHVSCQVTLFWPFLLSTVWDSVLDVRSVLQRK